MYLYFSYYLYKEIIFFCFVTYNVLCQNHLFTNRAYSDAHIVITNLSESQDNKTAKNKNHLIVVQ